MSSLFVNHADAHLRKELTQFDKWELAKLVRRLDKHFSFVLCKANFWWNLNACILNFVMSVYIKISGLTAYDLFSRLTRQGWAKGFAEIRAQSDLSKGKNITITMEFFCQMIKNRKTSVALNQARKQQRQLISFRSNGFSFLFFFFPIYRWNT